MGKTTPLRNNTTNALTGLADKLQLDACADDAANLDRIAHSKLTGAALVAELPLWILECIDEAGIRGELIRALNQAATLLVFEELSDKINEISLSLSIMHNQLQTPANTPNVATPAATGIADGEAA
ncbi:hypothetical protein [Corynebacterium pseudopelargi]|uniref:Uncharacterized protein n=1 Tax=Corynebacterium pseudopelargi TaxID=2080757 RepID=A0A3G6IS97_9CORY|nr:hypothetical protein [Corynebacterium pseudopelargi]AZA08505.1 hypothetical protein CPPEL_01795 [Corynebacterium pseudopelargi]